MPADRRPATGRAPRAGARPGAGARGGGRSGVRPGTSTAGRRTTPPAGSARTRRTTRIAIVALILVAMVVALAPTLRVYLHQRSQISSLRDQQRQQRQDVAAQQAQADRWKDPAYVEAQARARLQFVSPGQRSYTVVLPETPEAAAPASGVVAGATGGSNRSWMDSVWQSLQKAGTATSTGK